MSGTDSAIRLKGSPDGVITAAMTKIDTIATRHWRSSVAGRAYLKHMDSTALMNYTVLVNSPQIITRLPGVGARVRLFCASAADLPHSLSVKK